MPLPLILGIGAAVAGLGGVSSGVHGVVQLTKANKTMKEIEKRHRDNQGFFERKNKETTQEMDSLGELELSILKSFEKFSDIFEQIHNRPKFKEYCRNDVHIPEYNGEELRTVSVGAGVLIGGLGGAALGTAGGFAAAGATTSAVMALGTASTGTAIATLHGAAATNATLAALGGGSIAAGGGGMALGTTILGATTLGAGILVGGIVFGIVGSSLSKKADEARLQMLEAEKEIKKTCIYMEKLKRIADRYKKALEKVNNIFGKHMVSLSDIVLSQGKKDWNYFTEEEKRITKNTVMLVGLLNKMCKVQIVLQAKEKTQMNEINEKEVEKSIYDSEQCLLDNGLVV